MRTVGLVLCLGGIGACEAESVNFEERPDGGCVGSSCAESDRNSRSEGTSNPAGLEPAGDSTLDAGATGPREPGGASDLGPGAAEDSGAVPDDPNRPAPSAPSDQGSEDPGPAGSTPTAPGPNESDPDDPAPTNPAPGEPNPSSADPTPTPSDSSPAPAPSGTSPDDPSPAPTSTGPAEPDPTTPTPAPTPSLPEDEAIGGCGNQLLRNGGFDRGDVDWRTSSSWPGAEVILPWDHAALQREDVAPYAGTHLAWLGGIPSNPYDSHIVALEQVIVIPETASTLTFSGRVWIRTEEDNVGDPAAYDALYADLFDGPGDDAKVSWLAGAWTNLDATTGWVAFEKQTTTTYLVLGREVAFQLHSRTDPELVTSFWFDSLRLVAGCGR